ncbi:hypothetical protein Tco_1015696, partial [Tanacetum coccineum]
YTQIDINHVAGGNLKGLSAEEAWDPIEDCAQCDKQWKNLNNTIFDQTITNLKDHLVGNEVVRVKIPKCMSWLDAYDEPIGDLDMMEDKEIPNLDELEPQPQPLPSCPSFDISLIEERGPEPLIKPHSPDSFRIKMIEDDWRLESKEVSLLRKGLNLPVWPKELEKGRIK